SHHEGGFAALDNEDVGLRRMILGFARGFTVGHIECVVAIIGEALSGELFVAHLRHETLAEALQLRGLPQVKAGRIARRYGKSGKKQSKGKWFHAVTLPRTCGAGVTTSAVECCETHQFICRLLTRV